MNIQKWVAQIVRFLIGASVAGGLYYVVFLLLVEVFEVWYITAGCVGFVVNYGSGFYIQKYWAFKNYDTKKIYRQSGGYLAMKVGIFLANLALLLIGIELIKLSAITAQISSTLILVSVSFLLTRKIFKNH